MTLPLLKPAYCTITPAAVDDPPALRLFARHLASTGKAAETRRIYLQAVRRFAAFCADLTAPTEAAIGAWLRARRPVVGRGTLNQELTALRAFYSFALQFELAAIDYRGQFPAALRVPHRLPRTLDEQDVIRLLRATDGTTFIGLRDQAIILLAYESGLAARELIALQLTDIHDDPALYIHGRDSRSDRLVPISRHARLTLGLYCQARQGLRPGKQNSLFLTRRGKPFQTSKAIWDCVQRVARQAGLTQIGYAQLARPEQYRGWGQTPSPRILRATFAAQWLNHGGDLRSLQVMLGHQSIRSTAHYEPLNLTALKREHAKAFGRSNSCPTNGDHHD